MANPKHATRRDRAPRHRLQAAQQEHHAAGVAQRSSARTCRTKNCGWNTAISTCAGRTMQRTLLLRDRMIRSMRNYFGELGFIDVETPILGRSTPEGARDYLVPSRVHHGHVLRPAAVAAALQADPDDGRLRPLRAGRPLLPRRRPACRPPAGVHAARRGDVVRRRGRRDRHDRRPDGPAGQAGARHRT